MVHSLLLLFVIAFVMLTLSVFFVSTQLFLYLSVGQSPKVPLSHRHNINHCGQKGIVSKNVSVNTHYNGIPARIRLRK